jgi:hypothetical protein
MVETRTLSCPYCGEPFETGVDCSAGSQSYVEDCPVCCRPIEVALHVGHDGRLLGVEATRDDE